MEGWYSSVGKGSSDVELITTSSRVVFLPEQQQYLTLYFLAETYVVQYLVELCTPCRSNSVQLYLPHWWADATIQRVQLDCKSIFGESVPPHGPKSRSAVP
jgi:hypothetical protein